MADPQGMDVMCGAESSGASDWKRKLGGALEQWGAPAGGGGSALDFDMAPPAGTVPQSSFRQGSAAHQAMLNAAEWMHRDKEVASVEKGRHAAVNTDEFRNTAVGKGWKAKYVVRQSGLGGGGGGDKVVDMQTREAVKKSTKEEKEARRERKQQKRGWIDEYEAKNLPLARSHDDDSSDGNDSSSSSSSVDDRKSKKRKKEKKHKKGSKKHKKGSGKKRKKEKRHRESKEEKHARKQAEAVRSRLVAYLDMVPDLEMEELRSACEGEGFDPPPASAPAEMVRRVLTAKLTAKLQAHDRQHGGSGGNDDVAAVEEQPLFSRG